ncbi:MAG: type I-E CRISPR-associated protein Cse2/CasB [Candidatus Thorarchaeota archaeon]
MRKDKQIKKENESIEDSNSKKSDNFDQEFITELKNLKESDRGAYTALKRAAGVSIAQSRQGAIAAFYKILPFALMNSRMEEIYFIVATLYGHNDEYHFEGNFGETLHDVKNRFDLEGMDRRMMGLLDSNFEISKQKIIKGGELAYKLRQLVKLANSKNIGINWLHFLKDLKNWNHPEKFVQKKWARYYFGKKKETKNKK